MKSYRRRVAVELAVLIALGGLFSCMPLQAGASLGPPTYIPSAPQQDDHLWVPSEREPDTSQGSVQGETTNDATDTAQSPPVVQQPDYSDQTQLAQGSQSGAESPTVGDGANARFSTFKDALLGGDDILTLSSDIVMQEQIVLGSGRSLVIDADGHRISQGGTGRTILAGSDSNITIRNAVIDGYDAMGLIGAVEGNNLQIRFENVTYSGPQLCRNAATGDSRIVIQDCDITILTRGADSEGLVQGSWVEFAGTNSIRQQGVQYPTFGLEYSARGEPSYGDCDRGVIVRKGAHVLVQSDSFLIRGGSSAFVLEEGAHFQYTAPDGVNDGTDNGFGYVSVGREAELFLEQSGSNGVNADRAFTIADGGALRLEQASVFELVANDVADSSAAIDFRGEANVQILSPKRFRVAANSQVITTGTAKPSWVISGINAFNYWDASGSRYVWNDHTDGLTAFSLQVQNNGELYGMPDTVKDMQGMPMVRCSVNLYGTAMREMRMGNFSGALAVESWEETVQGFAATGANLSVAYYDVAGEALYAVSGTADGERTGENSMYAVDLPAENPPAGTELGIVASQEGLLVQRSSSAVRVLGGGGAAPGSMRLKVDMTELEEGSVETILTLQDEAARAWRLTVSSIDGGDPISVRTENAQDLLLDHQEVCIGDISPGETESSLTLEMKTPSKQGQTSDKKTLCWTVVFPLD